MRVHACDCGWKRLALYICLNHTSCLIPLPCCLPLHAGIDGSLTTIATTAAAGPGVKVPPSDSVDPDVVVGDDALPPAPLMSTEEHETAPNGAAGTYEDDTDSEGEFEDRMAEECARMHGPSPSVRGRPQVLCCTRFRSSGGAALWTTRL